MTDIIERLRKPDEGWQTGATCLLRLQAATEIEWLTIGIAELSSALAIMWHAYDSDNRPPANVLRLAKRCYELGRARLEGEYPTGDQ